MNRLTESFLQAIEINSSPVSILYFFGAIVISSIQLGLAEYEALYISSSTLVNQYTLAHNLKHSYVDGKQIYTLKASRNEIILKACPSLRNPDVLEIRDKQTNEIKVESTCEKPVISHIYTNVINGENLRSVGFPVYIPRKKSTEEPIQDDFNHFEGVHVIFFNFDEFLKRIKFLTYIIAMGKYLKPDITVKPIPAQVYHLDENIYGYDIDILYSWTSHQFVKVHLAPEEDFFFTNWKLASKHDTLTAPMSPDLVPQWQALEIFIRKISRVINYVVIKTGIHGALQQSIDNTLQNVYLHNDQYLIPKYFWKVVYVNLKKGKEVYRYGILFVMHNVLEPNTTNIDPNEPKICSEIDFVKLGWRFIPQDQFKSHMYACRYDKPNMAAFRENNSETFEIFDLNREVPSLQVGDDGEIIDITKVNVIEEMKKLDGI